jgi:hypothetical protein
MEFEIPKHLFHSGDWRGVEAFLQSCRGVPLEKVKQDLERYLGERKKTKEKKIVFICSCLKVFWILSLSR